MRVMLVTIGKELTLTGVLPSTAVGATASYRLTPRSGTPPYRTRLLSSTLPAEWTVTLNSDGTVDIATTEAESPGAFTLAFSLEDADRDDRTIIRSLTVIALPLEVSGSLSNFTVGLVYSDTLDVTGGVGDYSLPATTLPAGISAALAGGTASPITVSGTPTGAGLGPGTSFPFTASITVEDENGSTVTFEEARTITVTPVVCTLTLPDATVGVPYVGDANATGGTSGYVFTKIAGPSWMSVNSSTGAITGTPTGGALTGVTVTVRATDSEGNVGDGTDTMDIVVPKATFNPSDKGPNVALSNGNRDATRSSGTGFENVRCTTGKNTGKFYAEIEILTIPASGTVDSPLVGFCTSTYSLTDFLGNALGGTSVQTKNAGSANGFFFSNTGASNLGVFTDRTCVVSIAIDFDAGKAWIGRDNEPSGAFVESNATIVAGNSPNMTFTPNTTLFLAATVNRATHSCRINCGQDPYARTPPTGFGDWTA
jgi:hypothetical protein